ncbi:endolytic transglycosylase MltG [Evansella cellulosilytica]|uniref:Endolytic murein transglycosylase n=1 Tax=Evansella cellulosilytica (strain ATCC 21833 / DSM 2522 / FERM P-1141 / JCM 9156 / N-4) TaxID=649639 RepID=E6TVA9_EVAC2|nr:endolytic transglycosylase MltG [Evansella cellulosilytica]ADU29793.1 aminodeoxychorismate lyase [Evansella cellulosilytica DSM 2522]
MSEKKEKRRKKHREKLLERQKEASLVRKIVFVCLFLIILTVAGVGYGSYQYIMNAIGPVDESDDTDIEVSIPIGSTTTRIGEILEENGLISNASIFRYYVRFKNESNFQAGDYSLSRNMDMDDIILELKEGMVYQDYQISFTIPEGRWLERVIELAEENTNLSEEDILEVITDEEYLEELIERYEILEEVILTEEIRYPLEGYLFPARYDFVEEEITVEQLIETMINRTSSVLIDNGAAGSQYTYHEILTLASIIEGEARNDEERYRISGVIKNRLDRGMPLQMDPTVAYAHGEHLSRTTYDHLEIESPYNTYHVTGIPIGPINNPGEASIRAALLPEDHFYLYFYHSPNGDVYFTETLAEHEAVVGQYQ